MEPIREAEMQTQPGKRLNEESKKNGKVWKIVVGVVAAAVVVFFGACCILAHASTAFFPHTAINGVDVSGLTLQEAQSRLETVLPQRVCKIYLSEQNTVSPEEREPAASITFAELGISPEAGYDGTTKSAYILQHGKGYCSTGFTYLKSLLGKNTGYNSSLYWDSRQLDQAIARLSAVLNSKPLDMAFQVGDHSLQLTIAKDGRSVADNELRRSIQNVVQVSSEPEAIVDLPAEILPAKALTAQQLYDQLHGEVRNASYDSATDSIVPEQLGADFDIAAVQKAMDEAAPGETPDNLNYKPAMSNSFPGYKDGSYEKSFTEIIHFIDNRYRTIPDKRHRAIAGLSMGGFHTLYISLNYPDYFNYIGLFSAGLSANGVDPNSPMYTNLDEKLGNLKRSGYQLFWIGIGKDDFLYDANQQFRQRMDSLGMKYQYVESTRGHIWANWRAYLLQFAPMLFK